MPARAVGPVKAAQHSDAERVACRQQLSRNNIGASPDGWREGGEQDVDGARHVWLNPASG